MALYARHRVVCRCWTNQIELSARTLIFSSLHCFICAQTHVRLSIIYPGVSIFVARIKFPRQSMANGGWQEMGMAAVAKSSRMHDIKRRESL